MEEDELESYIPFFIDRSDINLFHRFLNLNGYYPPFVKISNDPDDFNLPCLVFYETKLECLTDANFTRSLYVR